MKMGDTCSPWRYGAGACGTPWKPELRRPTNHHYAPAPLASWRSPRKRLPSRRRASGARRDDRSTAMTAANALLLHSGVDNNFTRRLKTVVPLIFAKLALDLLPG